MVLLGQSPRLHTVIPETAAAHRTGRHGQRKYDFRRLNFNEHFSMTAVVVRNQHDKFV